MQLESMGGFFDSRADSYDSHMLDDLQLGEFYEAIAVCFRNNLPARLLDLGCGTGLELEQLLKLKPDMMVTGVDLSSGMLSKLKAKYADRKLKLICGSYFDADFGGHYDAVLSTYSLHHFSEEQKLSLYQGIYKALNPEGYFVFGDYTVSTLERQRELMAENDRLRKEHAVAVDDFYHFDTPFTAETEITLLKEAGFGAIEIVRQWENTSIIVAVRSKRGQYAEQMSDAAKDQGFMERTMDTQEAFRHADSESGGQS